MQVQNLPKFYITDLLTREMVSKGEAKLYVTMETLLATLL